MSNPLIARSRRARIRQTSVSLLLAAGMAVGGTAVSSVHAAAPVSAPSGNTPSVVGLRKGSYGDAVKVLQQALVRVGIGVVHGVDSYFGSATQASVKAFQRLKGLPITGVVDEATAVALGLASAPAATPAAAPAAAASGTLARGATGQAVKQLQQALINSGIAIAGGADGVFGAATQAALTTFQQSKGLSATGTADAATLSALAAVGAPAATGPMARGARGNTVKQLQQALLNAGIAVPGGADGIFGQGTETALKSFQQAKGLPATGTVDPATGTALGLGGNATPQASAASFNGLKLGTRGPAVVALQQAIIKMGWTLRGGADGVFGAATQSALILMQRSNGIAASGVVDDASARLLGLSSAAAAATATPAAAPAAPAAPTAAASTATTAAGYAAYDERGARVVALQKALITAGVTVRGGADGVFGGGTAQAVMDFQKARGLQVSGRVDAATAAALGLAAAGQPAAPAAVSVQLEAKPVQGPCFYGDTWAAARGAGRVHLGVDIGAAEGRELYAVATGRVSQIYTAATDALAGNGLKITRADGTYFFYAHLSSLAPGIAVGTQVTAGQIVGYVGHTGNAGVPHLHLEVHPGGGSAVNPYPIVKATGAC